MASHYGATRRMKCRGCGLRYDDFTTGMTFKEVRNLIIAIGWCTKKNKIKHGRRSGVLGYWHELKLQFWDQHVGMCETESDKQKRRQRRRA